MTSWCQKSKIRLADSEEDWIVLDRAYRVGLQHVTQQLSRYSKTWRKRHELMVMVIPRLPGLCDGQIPCGFGGSPGSQMVHFGGGDREAHSAGGGMKRNLEVVYLTYRNCSWKLQQWNISFFFLLKLCIVFCCTFNFPHLLYHPPSSPSSMLGGSSWDSPALEHAGQLEDQTQEWPTHWHGHRLRLSTWRVWKRWNCLQWDNMQLKQWDSTGHCQIGSGQLIFPLDWCVGRSASCDCKIYRTHPYYPIFG
jgi:hypothetical protein